MRNGAKPLLSKMPTNVEVPIQNYLPLMEAGEG